MTFSRITSHGRGETFWTSHTTTARHCLALIENVSIFHAKFADNAESRAPGRTERVRERKRSIVRTGITVTVTATVSPVCMDMNFSKPFGNANFAFRHDCNAENFGSIFPAVVIFHSLPSLSDRVAAGSRKRSQNWRTNVCRITRGIRCYSL